MEVINIIENKDGSATLNIEMTEEEQKYLIEYAVQDILKKHIEEYENGNA